MLLGIAIGIVVGFVLGFLATAIVARMRVK